MYGPIEDKKLFDEGIRRIVTLCDKIYQTMLQKNIEVIKQKGIQTKLPNKYSILYWAEKWIIFLKVWKRWDWQGSNWIQYFQYQKMGTCNEKYSPKFASFNEFTFWTWNCCLIYWSEFFMLFSFLDKKNYYTGIKSKFEKAQTLFKSLLLVSLVF